jgi:hypothetical protein
VTAVQQGDAHRAINAVPDSLQAPLIAAVHTSFASALNVLLIVSGALALVGAAGSGFLIRRKDFVVTHQPASAAPTTPVHSNDADAIGAESMGTVNDAKSVHESDSYEDAPSFETEPLHTSFKSRE